MRVRTSARCTNLSIIAAATTSSENVSPQRANGKFEVTMIVPIPHLGAINWKNRLAAS